MMKWTILSAASLAWAQPPAITDVHIDSLDTTSFRVFVTAASSSWIEVLYGTKPGVYPYNTKSTNCFDQTCSFSAGKTALSVSGLAPGTTYYVRATARPNPNDDINICNTATCGAVELTVTTLPGTVPSSVVPPQQWAPSLPDTTSYTVVSMQVGSTGECQAAATISSPDGWSVNAGDYVQTVLNEVGYGAVLEFPQRAICKVPLQGGTGSFGYDLPPKNPDSSGCGGPCAVSDSRHRWIVLRTAQVLSGDFPPYGTRITPAWSAKLAKLYTSNPSYGGQLFDAELGTAGVHHFWFQNMEWADDPAYVNPTDIVDPPGFNYFARLGSAYQKNNNQYLVLDRIYAHGPGAPVRHIRGYELGGNFVAMIGCYTSQVESWRMTAWPSNNGTLNTANTVLSIPRNNFRLQSTSPLLGMNAAAQVTLTNGTTSGVVIGNLYKDHLEIQYTSGSATLTCQNCSVVSSAVPSTPATAMALFTGSIANGQFAQLIWNTAEWQTSQYTMSLGVMFSDLQGPGGPYYFDNNYLDGVGEGFYIDPLYSNFSNDDITYVRNHQIWPKNYFVSDPNWIGWRYEVRQHWESKRSHRVNLIGNVFSYSWSFQNDGPAIFLSGRPTYNAQTLNDGLSDINVDSNIVRHGRSGIVCNGGSSIDNGANSYDGEMTRRVTITNNFMYDLGRWKYCDTLGCPGFESFYFENRPGCQDLVIKNNTAGLTYGDLPAWLYVGGGTNPSNYIAFENNVLFYSESAGGGTVWGDWPANFLSNHDIVPGANYNNNGVSPPFVDTLNQSFMTVAATVTPTYVWKNNVAIGGWVGQQGAVADLTETQLSQYALNAPLDSFPAGTTIAARAEAAGFPNAIDNNFLPSAPTTAGVDFAKLTALQGLTTGVIAPKVRINTAQFSYVSPDSRSCSVDVSNDGVNWNRTLDAGGQTQRGVTVMGLSPATRYQYRILCYYEQNNDGVLYTEYTPDQITNGTFTTVGKTSGK